MYCLVLSLVRDFTNNFQQILHFKNLKILYLHGNVIYNLEVVTQLQPLQELRSLTLHGNPMDSLPQYRTTVLHLLPQLTSLDFVRVVRSERLGKPPQCHQDIVRGKKKSLPKDWFGLPLVHMEEGMDKNIMDKINYCLTFGIYFFWERFLLWTFLICSWMVCFLLIVYIFE